MTEPVNVREATADDARRLALIGSATFLETFAGILDGAAILDHCETAHHAKAYAELLREGGLAWLAEAAPGGTPVGFALLTPPNLPGAASDGSDLELKRIYILARFHGSGLGAALLAAAREAARARGARRLLLGVYAGNARAQGFYRKLGFAEVARRRFKVGAEEYDDIVFALPLA